jgi:ABC-2 type transport system permease protein
MKQTGQLSKISRQSYFRALLAIGKNDWLHFTRYPLNAIFRVIQPIMWLAPVYFMGLTFAIGGEKAGFAAYTGTGDYMSFILVGAMLAGYISSVFWGIGQSLKNDMDSGVLESNWMTPVPRGLFLVGHTIANLIITTIVNANLLLLGWLLFGFEITGNLLLALVAALPMLIALYGFGFGFAAIVMLIRDANTLIDVSDYLISIFSGGQFPVQVLPRFLLPISLAIPLTYGLDAVRGLLIKTNTLMPIAQEITILVIFMLVTVPLGYFIFKRVEQRSKRLGTLGMH